MRKYKLSCAAISMVYLCDMFDQVITVEAKSKQEAERLLMDRLAESNYRWLSPGGAGAPSGLPMVEVVE